MPNDNHVSFVTDDEPDTPDAVRLHVMAIDDYYIAVSQTERWPMGHAYRGCTSGARNPLLVFLLAAIYKLGKGDLKGAIACAKAFAEQAEVERTL